MLLKRHQAALAAGIAALAIGSPVASAASGPAMTQPARIGPPMISTFAAIAPANVSANPNPTCPAWYTGPTNLATGCPYWLMS
jgi:hypothetical protein